MTIRGKIFQASVDRITREERVADRRFLRSTALFFTVVVATLGGCLSLLGGPGWTVSVMAPALVLATAVFRLGLRHARRTRIRAEAHRRHLTI